MNIVIIENENNYSEWVKMEKSKYIHLYTVYHYVNNEVERKCSYDDFFAAVETMKEWVSYFE